MILRQFLVMKCLASTSFISEGVIMAIWQHDETGERFDDGLGLYPGDDGFTRSLAEAHFGNPRFSFVSTPSWDGDGEEQPA